jgi:hypothetical protein
MADDRLTMLPLPCACITRNSCFMLRGGANVGTDEFYFCTGGAKLGGQGFAGVIATTGNDDTGAFLGEDKSAARPLRSASISIPPLQERRP